MRWRGSATRARRRRGSPSVTTAIGRWPSEASTSWRIVSTISALTQGFRDFLDGSGHARTVSRVVKRTVCGPQLTMSFEVAAEQRADFDARTVRAVHQPDLPQ